jgi:hypothetical protein
LVTEPARCINAIDHSPVDHQSLRTESRPFDKAERDPLVRPGSDGIDHVRVGDRCRVTFALQQEFRMINAARDVSSKSQQEIHLLRCVCRRERNASRYSDQQDSNE